MGVGASAGWGLEGAGVGVGSRRAWGGTARDDRALPVVQSAPRHAITRTLLAVENPKLSVSFFHPLSRSSLSSPPSGCHARLPTANLPVHATSLFVSQRHAATRGPPW